MIITCPQCAVRYNLSAAQIGPQGKKLRCVKCNHEWFQQPETATAEPAAPIAPDTTETPSTEKSARTPLKLDKRLIALPLVVIIIGLVGFIGYTLYKPTPKDTVLLYNQTLSPIEEETYDTPTGLTMSAIEREIVEDGPVTMLVFKGTVTNNNSVTTTVPEIRVQLLSEDGAEIDFWPATLDNKVLEENGSTNWSVRFLNPPLEKIYEYRAYFRE